MCCCGKKVEPEELSSDDPDFYPHGLQKNMGRFPFMADIIPFTAFCVFWAVEFFYVSPVAFTNGEPARLYSGVDYLGNVCGLAKAQQSVHVDRGLQMDTTGTPNWYAFNLITVGAAPVAVGICVGSGADKPKLGCPTALQDKNYVNPLKYEAGKDGGFATLAEIVASIADPAEGTLNMTYFYKWVRPTLPTARSKSAPYCVLSLGSDASDDQKDMDKQLEKDQSTPQAQAKRQMADIQNAAGTITICAVVALLAGLFYVFFVSKCAKIIVWSAVILAGVGMAVLGYYLMNSGNTMTAAGDEDGKTWTYVGYAFFALAFIYACVICFMRKTINKAIAIVELACAAIMDMFSLVFWPIIPYCALLVVVGYTLVVMLYLYSSGELVVEYGVRQFKFDEVTQNYMWFNLFALLWGMNFITDFGNCVLAWATTGWYFTKCPQDEAGEYIKPSARTDAEDTSTRTSAPLCKAIANTFCYSMGIIAFGSFVIAVVQFIRAVLLYIQKQAESTNNRVMVCIARCLQCYMACVESCMKYITKNAYILHTIEGGGFCKNGINVITLLMSNMSLMSLMSVVSGGVCFIGKLFVCLFSTAVGYVLLDMDVQAGTISSWYFPLLIIFILTWVIGTIFMDVYDMIMDSLTVCYIQDTDNCKQAYAPPGLSDQDKAAKEASKAGSKADDEEEDATGKE